MRFKWRLAKSFQRYSPRRLVIDTNTEIIDIRIQILPRAFALECKEVFWNIRRLSFIFWLWFHTLHPQPLHWNRVYMWNISNVFPSLTEIAYVCRRSPRIVLPQNRRVEHCPQKLIFHVVKLVWVVLNYECFLVGSIFWSLYLYAFQGLSKTLLWAQVPSKKLR